MILDSEEMFKKVLFFYRVKMKDFFQGRIDSIKREKMKASSVRFWVIVTVDYLYNLKMSIFRGANKTVQVIKKSKDLTLLHPNSEKQELMNELKLLLKENTLLKQENLDLKQQIMLGKIEIQNLKIKF